MLKTLTRITKLFDDEKIEYCLIGGLAMMLHNGRANTVDIDFYVLVNDLKSIRKIFEENKYRTRNAGEYQIKAFVDNVQIDILYADHYIGADVVKRSVPKKLGDSVVQVATPEDLIILKTLADRTVDRRDIEELRELFGKLLDEVYISKTVNKLKKMLAE